MLVHSPGQLDDKDVNIVVQRIMNVLRYGLPSSAGFGAGFLYGKRETGAVAEERQRQRRNRERINRASSKAWNMQHA